MSYDGFDKEYLKCKAENKRLKGLLSIALCPNVTCGCQNGIMPNFIGEMERCQWCSERDELLGG